MSAASRKAWFDARRQVNTWLTKADYRRLERTAKEAGETVSAFARNALVDAISAPVPSGSEQR